MERKKNQKSQNSFECEQKCQENSANFKTYYKAIEIEKTVWYQGRHTDTQINRSEQRDQKQTDTDNGQMAFNKSAKAIQWRGESFQQMVIK